MRERLKRGIYQVGGMTCSGCAMRIENALKRLDGVIEVKAAYSNANVIVAYDANIIEIEQIIQTIEKLDYEVKNKPGTAAVSRSLKPDLKPNSKPDSKPNSKPDIKKAAENKMSVRQLIGISIILLALYLIIKNTVGFDYIPEINQSMGYGILFIVGLLTSLHCISMCGGINLSQSVSYNAGNSDTGKNGKLSKLKPSLLYNGGRVVSYTIIGGIVGALGSGVSFSGDARGIVAVISGVFMVIMGLNMLNIFPWLRRINPRMPKIFSRKMNHSTGTYRPFYVGLLNGLMPCGPLQAMQIYALGTGNFAAGALSMFMFSIGTVPLMFGFGALSSVLSGKFTHKMMKVSAVLVIVLGVVMANRGLALSGFSLPTIPIGKNIFQSSGTAVVKNDVQIVVTKLLPGSYEPITVLKGMPVRWVIKAGKNDINGCNNEIIIPRYNISKKLEPGENIIEFTPSETGTIAYSCWMGMIRSKITVVEDINDIET